MAESQTVVSLRDVPVMFVASTDGAEGAADAFTELESRFQRLVGRKFYATSNKKANEYRACVAILPGDDPAKLGLETWTIPGGLYVQTRLGDWIEQIEQISDVFDRMAASHKVDEARPSIEYYPGGSEALLYLPVGH